jgi:hypothetical protein
MGTAKARTQRFRVTVTPTEGWLHPLDRALYETSGVGREAFHGVRQLDDETVIALAEVTGPVDRIEAACTDTDHVVSHTVSPLESGWLLFAWIEPTPVVEQMLRLRREARMLTEPPFEWTDTGSLRLDVVGRADSIRGAVERLRADVDVSVDHTADVDADGLTAAHRTVVETAVASGYYATPQTATLGDVAATVDTSRDRTERLLREAERELFTRVVEHARR